MSRKHLRLIAFALFDARPVDPEGLAVWRRACEGVADGLQEAMRDDKRLLSPFNRARFLAACETGYDNPRAW